MDLPRSRETRFQMVSGSIKARVDRVVTGGSYNVQTESMVAGVRGTEFQVSTDGDEATLAVQEGSVYYLPTSVDPLALLDTFPGDPPPRLRRIVERLVDEAPRVQSGREVTLRRDDVEEAAQLIDRLEEQIIDISENPDTATFGQYDALEETVGDLVDAVRPLEEEERSQRRNTREEVGEIDTMNIQDVDPQSGRPGGTQVSISTDPPNADIFINGAFRGINRLEGLFPVGEALSVRVSAQGYEDFTRRIVPQPATPIRLNVQLRRPVQGVRVNASPSNAEVVINGRSYGRGTVNAEFQDGTELRVEVSAPGYNPQVRTATVRRARPLELDVALEETIAGRDRASAGRLVDRLTVTPAGLVSVDEFGTVGTLGADGDRVWAVDTANTPMDRGFPVYADERIYLSGPAEFVVINAAGGNVINREEVPRERAHLFGRRVTLRGEEVVYPTNESLRIYDRDGALQRTLSLPGTSLTTPAPWRNTLVTILQDGTLIALDAESGDEVLRVETGARQPVALAPTIRNDVAYFSGNRGTAVAVDLEGERVMWEQAFTGGSVAVTHDLTVTRSAVYAYGQGRLFAKRRAGGTQLFDTLNGVAAPPLYREGILYVPMADERIRMLDAETGEELHSVRIGEGLTTRPAVSGDTAAVGSNRGTVIRLKLLDGNLVEQ
jgi:outer membrane protein assembly factor BamB